MGHDTGEDVAILARTGKDANPLATWMLRRVVTEETNRDSGDSVVPEKHDAGTLRRIGKKAGAVVDTKADGCKDKSGQPCGKSGNELLFVRKPHQSIMPGSRQRQAFGAWMPSWSRTRQTTVSASSSKFLGWL